jgi:hypothetical protein
MVYAMLYAENADIVGTYDSFEAAASDLAEFVNAHPGVQDEIGLRRYADGKPVGEFMPASEVAEGKLAQQHLIGN